VPKLYREENAGEKGKGRKEDPDLLHKERKKKKEKVVYSRRGGGGWG